jgi:amino acid transporter
LLLAHRIALGVGFVALIAFANLRGVRESGRVFAVPTYVFIATFAVLVGVGLYRTLRGDLQPLPAHAAEASTALTWFLMLRAFSSGCTALTGVEAISNGVPAFKPPESRNASITMGWMAGILGGLFLGITVLAWALRVTPVADETVVSQIARALFGTGLFYYLVQASTMLILVLAANTSFADFPRLSSLLSRDRYAPRQFGTLGDRLVFSNGILILGGLAALLLVVFRGETHALIPLYAVGVFLSFTLSQAGMIRHWLTVGGHPGWRWRLAVNGTGAVVTGVVTLVIGATKFTHGAWMVVLLIPVLVMAFKAVHRHYEAVAEELSLDHLVGGDQVTTTVLVLVGDLHLGVVRALRFAQSLAPNPKAVYVETDPARTLRLEERWTKGGCGVPLVVLGSPYRSVLRPLFEYIERIQQQSPRGMIAIVIPEFVPRHWWQQVLHNQTALLVKGALLFRRGIVVVDVPFHLQS